MDPAEDVYEAGVQKLELGRDYPDIEQLFSQEGWPFTRRDLELSQNQSKATSFVCRQNSQFAGFFSTHNFGHVAYLDNMITLPEFRKWGVARRLYCQTMQTLRAKSLRSFVVHTTNQSAPMIEYLGFDPGPDYTLLRREPGRGGSEVWDDAVVELGPADLEDLVVLDERLFGIRRTRWVEGLFDRADNYFFGARENGRLVASVCLRTRRNSALCIDSVHVRDTRFLPLLIRHVAARFGDRRLECFARVDSELEEILKKMDFSVPEFFRSVGPLTEWRKGDTDALGSPLTAQSLNWF